MTDDATLELMIDVDSNTITVTVHHTGCAPIGSSTYLIVASIFGVCAPIVEYCSGV